MDIQDFQIFARVAALQNLSQVGTDLGLTPGTISKRLQAMEDELGVRLFDRTTRSIRITDEGATFLSHVERILAEFESARAALGESIARPKGRLRLAVPTAIGTGLLVEAIEQFMRTYPEVLVQVDVTDRQINLHDDGFDVAIRTGQLADSSVIAKRLAEDPQVLVASPSYLERVGRPERPEALASHACLAHVDSPQWTFRQGGIEIQVRPGGALRSNSSEYLLAAAIAGGGIAQVSAARAEPHVVAGRLAKVLETYEVSPESAIWAVYPSNRHVLPKLRLLLDMLADRFRESSTEASKRQTRNLSPSTDKRLESV